jgi:hypothetical protein
MGWAIESPGRLPKPERNRSRVPASTVDVTDVMSIVSIRRARIAHLGHFNTEFDSARLQYMTYVIASKT